MKRREFITLLGGAAAWPVVAWGQQAAMPVIGILSSQSANASQNRVRAMRRDLIDAGYIEGQNVLIEYRWANGRYDQLPELAADLVRRHVSIIAALGDSSALAAKAATNSIAIVFIAGNDPIKHGLVTSLNRPGGNLTGVVNLNIELGPKRLELLRELVPSATDIAMLVNPTSANAESALQELPAAARSMGLQMHALHASTPSEIELTFASLRQRQVGALIISGDNFFNGQSEQLGSLCARHAVPAIFQTRDFVLAGGLMSYGGSVSDLSRRFCVYIGRILKGEKPGDLPVEQATKVELIINQTAAKALGITLPLTILGRADEVIE
jgi:putative ABC transport system substrate-binding protein